MKLWNYIFYLLALMLIGIGIAIYQLPDSNLHIIVCDVGQGDGILFVYKNIEILTDGGPDKKIINCLSNHMPFWDREIELVISTHPDADHSTGLIEILKDYKINKILINPIDSGTQTIRLLQNLIKTKGVGVLSPVEGQKVKVGLIYLDIVNPSVAQINSLTQKVESSPLNFFKPIDDTNDYSISYFLAFGKFKGLFTGDLGPKTSDRLAEAIALNGVERVNYIKIPHHGSRNGLTQNLLEKIMPKLAVISVGKKNRYGHPHQEILEMLAKYNIKTFRTDEIGDVELVTDGDKYWMRK